MTLSPIALSRFQQALTPLVVKRLKMIYFAQVVGTLFFAGSAIWLTFQPGSARPEQPGSEKVVQLLTLANGAFAAAMYALSKFFFRLILRGERVTGEGATADSIIVGLVNAEIVRLTLLEMAAFLGIAVVLVANGYGVLGRQPLYWGNLATAVLLLALAAFKFPSQASVTAEFEKTTSSQA